MADGDFLGRQKRKIEEWLAPILEPGQVVEVRCIGPVSSRVFATAATGELERLAGHAAQRSGKHKGVYFTPNPLASATLAEAAKDGDVAVRLWLLVDVDPVRPADLNSTDAEHEAARVVAESIRSALEARGFAGIGFGDSGNGYHLMVPVTLANDDAGRGMHKQFLLCLQERFGTPGAKVDATTHNASRIWKLPGTLAMKAPASHQRPQRYAKIIEAPDRSHAETNTGHLVKLLSDWYKPKPQSKPDRYAAAALEKECGAVVNASDGERNNRLNQAAFSLGQLVAGGLLDRETVRGALIHAARGAGLTEAEAERTIASGLDAGGKQPRTAPEPERNGKHTAAAPVAWDQPVSLAEIPPGLPFPLDALPAAPRRFAEELSWAMNVPMDSIALALLAVASGAIGNSRRLKVKDSYYQSAAVYAAFVSRPGSLKSSVLAAVTKPLADAEDHFRQQHADAVRVWEANGKQGSGPSRRKCMSSGGTVEAISRLLASNPRGMLLCKDELKGLVDGMNQYKGGKGDDRQFFLSAWDQTSYSAERVDDSRSVFIRHPYLAVVGGIQPEKLAEMRDEAADDGFIDRFLFAYPPERPEVEEQWRDISEATARGWTHAVSDLLAMTFRDGKPQVVTLDPAARIAYQSFTRRHAEETNHEDFPDRLRGPWAKLRGYCLRLTLILYCLDLATEGFGEGMIQAGQIERAERLTDYFKSHARRVGWVAVSGPDTDNAAAVLKYLVRRSITRSTFRTLYRGLGNSNRFETMARLRATLGLLCRHGFIREVPETGNSSGGRPRSEAYEVHPDKGVLAGFAGFCGYFAGSISEAEVIDQKGTCASRDGFAGKNQSETPKTPLDDLPAKPPSIVANADHIVTSGCPGLPAKGCQNLPKPQEEETF